MGNVALVLLDGKHRLAEDVFGWGRSVVQVGIILHREYHQDPVPDMVKRQNLLPLPAA